MKLLYEADLRQGVRPALGDIETRMNLLSITITPPDRCQELLRLMTLRLPHDGDLIAERFQPHLTLQMIYGVEDVAAVRALLQRMGSATRPPVITMRSTPRLFPRTNTEDVSLGAEVQKTPELEELYRRLQTELTGTGLRSSCFSPQEWLPHVTLMYVSEPPDEHVIRVMHDLISSHAPCSFVAATLELNRLDEHGRWVEIESIPLAGQGTVGRKGEKGKR